MKWKRDDVIEAESKEEALDKTIAWMEGYFFTDVYKEDIEIISIDEME